MVRDADDTGGRSIERRHREHAMFNMIVQNAGEYVTQLGGWGSCVCAAGRALTPAVCARRPACSTFIDVRQSALDFEPEDATDATAQEFRWGAVSCGSGRAFHLPGTGASRLVCARSRWCIWTCWPCRTQPGHPRHAHRQQCGYHPRPAQAGPVQRRQPVLQPGRAAGAAGQARPGAWVLVPSTGMSPRLTVNWCACARVPQINQTGASIASAVSNMKIQYSDEPVVVHLSEVVSGKGQAKTE